MSSSHASPEWYWMIIPTLLSPTHSAGSLDYSADYPISNADAHFLIKPWSSSPPPGISDTRHPHVMYIPSTLSSYCFLRTDNRRRFLEELPASTFLKVTWRWLWVSPCILTPPETRPWCPRVVDKWACPEWPFSVNACKGKGVKRNSTWNGEIIKRVHDKQPVGYLDAPKEHPWLRRLKVGIRIM